jgi:hypothetical protein
MKKMALYLLYTALFFGALLFFTPKENVYYFAEEQLKPLGVIIADEEAVDHGFTLELTHLQIYVQKIKSAEIGSATLAIFGLYNSLSAADILLDKTFEAFFPPLIHRADLHQSLIDPLHINASAVGDFGEAEASVDLLERSVKVFLKPSRLMRSRYKNTLKNLKRTKEGDYSYEYKF